MCHIYAWELELVLGCIFYVVIGCCCGPSSVVAIKVDFHRFLSLSLSYLFIIIFFLLNLVARSQFQKAKRLQPYVHNFK